MTETAGHKLSQVVPACRWLPQTQPNPTSTSSAYPRFPDTVREWTGFFQGVRRTVDGELFVIPGGQFPYHGTNARPLRVEDDAKIRFYTNVLFPVETILEPTWREATFCATPAEFLGLSDYVLCNSTVGKMPVKMKAVHDLDLRGYNLWEVCQCVDQDQIMNRDPNFKFKKEILSQAFGAMACNGLHYGILSTYSDTYFLKREEASPTTLYATRVVKPDNINPTLRECVYYISRLALIDDVSNRLTHVETDNVLTDNDNDNDDNDDPDNGSDDNYNRKRKRGSKKKTGNNKKAKNVNVVASSSKGITTIDKYIGGGSFGKVFFMVKLWPGKPVTRIRKKKRKKC